MPFPWITIIELKNDILHSQEWMAYADERLGQLVAEGRLNQRRFTNVDQLPNGNMVWIRRWATQEDAENWIEFAKGFEASGFVSGSAVYQPESD